MASKDAPCKNCDDRYYGCHIGCDRYKSYSDAIKKESERRAKEKEIENGIIEHKCRIDYKVKRSTRTGKIFRSPKR